MSRRRPKKYPAEFKEDAIAMVRANPDVTVKEIAARLGVNYWTLGTWYREDELARKHGKKKKSPKVRPKESATDDPLEETAEQRAARLERENAALRKKVEQLEMDRAILKKAAAFFAKESE